MKFDINSYQYNLFNVIRLLVWVLIGAILGKLNSNGSLNYEIFGFVLAGLALGYAATFFSKKYKHLEYNFENSTLNGPRSFNPRTEMNEICTSEPYVVKRLWFDYPAISYKVSQSDKKIVFSSIGIGLNNTRKLHDLLENT